MVAFGCVAVSGGKFYYGDATVRHSGPQSVTLVLRNVEDLKPAATAAGRQAREEGRAPGANLLCIATAQWSRR